MPDLKQLIENNRAWAAEMVAENPRFFSNLTEQQSPDYLWIGCSDSRVPANEIVGLLPGELFVHRNVANLVIHTDLNCLSVIQYAVYVLGVEHIIVCGHYGCGGIMAALTNNSFGLIDNWLRHVQDIIEKHGDHIASLATDNERHDRLCELNVIEQVVNVCRTTIIQHAWELERPLTIHGWIYKLSDGLIRDLGVSVSSKADMIPKYRAALAALGR
jgi:carbonic anhydrase